MNDQVMAVARMVTSTYLSLAKDLNSHQNMPKDLKYMKKALFYFPIVLTNYIRCSS